MTLTGLIMARPKYVDISETDRDQFLCGADAQEALRIIGRLREKGFVAYLAGGCVRDALLGMPPKDYDVATDATPDSVRQVFGRSNTLAFGASFGVIGVLPKRDPNRGADEVVNPTEVATFRSDGVYSDGRRPDSVHFGKADQDALRRDFTINGLFYDPAKHEIVDFVGGEDDLRRGVLRTIGDAATRIEEDKLRMLRAVRFATTLRFEVAPETVDAIRSHAAGITAVSGERIGAEMRRVLTSENSRNGLAHLRAFGLDPYVLPELEGLDWSRYESYVDRLAPRTFPNVLACLLVSMADPLTSLAAIASRWRLSGEESRKATAAIKHWRTIEQANTLPWSIVQPILVDRDRDTIVEVASAIVTADEGDRGGIDHAAEAIRWPAEQLNPAPLLTGNDLHELGVPKGPQYRTILQSIRDAQLDQEIQSREDAIGLLSDLT